MHIMTQYFDTGTQTVVGKNAFYHFPILLLPMSKAVVASIYMYSIVYTSTINFFLTRSKGFIFVFEVKHALQYKCSSLQVLFITSVLHYNV